MKNAPFLLSSALALLAVVLSFVSFGASQTNNSLQSDFLKKQTEFQDLNNAVQLQSQEYQRQGEFINNGNNQAKNIMQPLLVEMGYRAAKNKNEKLKTALRDTKFQDVIFDADKVKEMDKALEQNKVKQSGAAPLRP